MRLFFYLLLVYPPDLTWNRVVGGKDAPDGAAPFQCSLQTNKRHFCGCSIISDKWILTAAHCLYSSSPISVKILVGTVNLKNGGKFYTAERFVLHESYNDPQYAHDIALIRVKETIAFNDKVQPVCNKANIYRSDEILLQNIFFFNFADRTSP